MITLEYRCGYLKALMDLEGWINHPMHPLDRKWCTPQRLAKILCCVVENVDAFMDCPDTFQVCGEIDKKGRARVWREDEIIVRGEWTE